MHDCGICSCSPWTWAHDIIVDAWRLRCQWCSSQGSSISKSSHLKHSALQVPLGLSVHLRLIMRIAKRRSRMKLRRVSLILTSTDSTPSERDKRKIKPRILWWPFLGTGKTKRRKFTGIKPSDLTKPLWTLTSSLWSSLEALNPF